MSEAEGGDSSQNDPDTQAYTLSPVCFTHQVHPHLLNRSHSVSSTSTWTSSCSHPAVNQHMEQYLYPEQRANDTATTSLTLSSVDGHSPAVAFATFAGQSVNSANPDSGKTAGGQSVISGFARAYEGRPVQLEPAPPGKQHTSSTSTPSSSYTQNYHYTPSSYLPSIVPLKAPPSRANGRNVESSCSSSTLLPGITASCSRPAQGVDYGHQEGNRLHNTAGTQSSGAHSPSTEWPREDILSLLHVLNEVDGRSWTEIAKRAFVDDKYTASQCQAKWREISKERKFVNRGPWRFEEDQALLEAIQLLGAEKWVVIATQVGARNGKQCRERWHNHLSPSSELTEAAVDAHGMEIPELSFSFFRLSDS